MSIKAKQVAGVTTLVVAIVAVLSAYHLATYTRLRLEDAVAQGEMLAQAIRHRAHQVVREAGGDPYAALREDGGVRAMLESSIGYSPTVLYAAIVRTDGAAVAHSSPSLEGQPMEPQNNLREILGENWIEQLDAVYGDRTFEVRQPLVSGDQQFGVIRIGVSTIFIREELRDGLRGAIWAVVGTLAVSSMIAVLLSQWMLRPIHVIQSGLSRLGRGELDVRLDLPEHEFKDLGSSFDAVSAQISALGRAGNATTPADRPGAAGDLESVMDNLEDAVALFSPSGELIFSNTAMESLLHEIGAETSGGSTLAILPAAHPLKQLVDRTLAGRKSAGPIAVNSMDGRVTEAAAESERMLMSHAIVDTSGRFLGAMLVARNIGYLSQVYSTLNYSRKLAALGRLMAGVAHEVKNPLNAMTIHLELLKQKMVKRDAAQQVGVTAGGAGAATATPTSADVAKHVHVIADEIRRLDEVVAGFLKFARPDELRLQPVDLGALMSDVATTVAPEAESRGIIMKTECPEDLPDINADPGMLQQAVLNLAINACQAMPDGGTLRLACRTATRRRVELQIGDTGVGIPPEHLGRIFDLYFTTKNKGSGIGLSMVYRIMQLHDGEVEVESTPGAGTTFKLVFPQA